MSIRFIIYKRNFLISLKSERQTAKKNFCMKVKIGICELSKRKTNKGKRKNFPHTFT
jgi:hypothetical protein